MVRPVAQRMFNAVMMDDGASVSPACVVDFDLGFTQHEFEERFGALQHAARRGATPEEFDEALGSGDKLTALVQSYGSSVVFPKSFYED